MFDISRSIDRSEGKLILARIDTNEGGSRKILLEEEEEKIAGSGFGIPIDFIFASRPEISLSLFLSSCIDPGPPVLGRFSL